MSLGQHWHNDRGHGTPQPHEHRVPVANIPLNEVAYKEVIDGHLRWTMTLYAWPAETGAQGLTVHLQAWRRCGCLAADMAVEIEDLPSVTQMFSGMSVRVREMVTRTLVTRRLVAEQESGDAADLALAERDSAMSQQPEASTISAELQESMLREACRAANKAARELGWS